MLVCPSAAQVTWGTNVRFSTNLDSLLRMSRAEGQLFYRKVRTPHQAS